MLASKRTEEVINSALGQPTLKQLLSYFQEQLNPSLLIALLGQEGLHS